MALRMLTNQTRQKLQEILSRLELGDSVTLEERIQLNKYSLHIPFIAGKLAQALRKRDSH
ncbi:hypothetical protein [Prochlorococcus sp. MIT 1341]|uniref:hypothetical protein n=1 Tax=Prochlorococcus sp. MIT 1341 TaxID=3096221 RepID=UPI002A756987|nr:hypothetical protein [Prochlorococcus sp. MIT 1341]